MNTLPRITLVTPSFNQARTLEQTIQSVLSQEYPNLEYIIVDGASGDSSVDIISRYAEHLAWWVSEPDQGQSEAINKGMARASGVVANWLCSDDLLLPGALRAVAAAYERQPEAATWYGDGVNLDLQGRKLGDLRAEVLRPLDIGAWIPEWSGTVVQPACFFNLAHFRSVGGVSTDLHLMMDVDLWARLAKLGPFIKISAPLAANRTYPETKSSRAPLTREFEHLRAMVRMQREDLALQRFATVQELLLGAMEQRSGRQALALECSKGLSWQTLLMALTKKVRRRPAFLRTRRSRHASHE